MAFLFTIRLIPGSQRFIINHIFGHKIMLEAARKQYSFILDSFRHNFLKFDLHASIIGNINIHMFLEKKTDNRRIYFILKGIIQWKWQKVCIYTEYKKACIILCHFLFIAERLWIPFGSSNSTHWSCNLLNFWITMVRYVCYVYEITVDVISHLT